ncbi:envelope glycoprotein N [Spheniscid alphaherpesvirus 1]|uniref:Envelope glycoprotein N n=1 Tax=Spheniscid alphaherpesvirus 1 TaxID=2560777 RepID=A0A1R3TEJ4_9ALPH|nr:envelope glycoprotein N [Spheniscid alphaherpesvirus 1]SCO83500.1 envelope glycoprotein N [Spheniscid alphaherpesvirus 1]
MDQLLNRAIAMLAVFLLVLYTANADSSAYASETGVVGAGNPAAAKDFWHPGCSARGISLAFSSTFSILFYLSLLSVSLALLAGSYHACFRLFTREVLSSSW